MDAMGLLVSPLRIGWFPSLVGPDVNYNDVQRVGKKVRLLKPPTSYSDYDYVGVSKIGVPQNGWFIMENHIKMDDMGVRLFSDYDYVALGGGNSNMLLFSP